MRTPDRRPIKWSLSSRTVGLCLLVLIFGSLMDIRGDASGQSMDFKPASLTNDARRALQVYLDRDCDLTSPRKKWPPTALERLLRISADEPELETRLIRLLRSGPDKDALEIKRQSLKTEWTNLKIFLDQKPDLGLRPNDMQILQRVTDSEEAYTNRALDRIMKRYQERSAIALLTLANHGSVTANKAINEIMKTGNTESNSAIRKARKQLATSAESKRGQ